MKYPLFTTGENILTVFALSGIGLLFVTCGKDDPEPGPVPSDPVPPTPPTPVVPDAPRAVALRLLALPAGDNPEPWSVADTLHLVLAEPNGRTALGDTALYRYAFGEGADHPGRFLPVTVVDSAFLPSDSSEVDLMAYRPGFGRPAIRQAPATGRQPRTDSPGTPPDDGGTYRWNPCGQHECKHYAGTPVTRLYVSLNKASKANLQRSSVSATKADETTITFHGNPAQGIWSLPDEAFVEYGEPVSQPFIVQSDGTGGYLYALPGWPGQPDGQKPELSLTVQIPEHDPLEIPLNKYLPEGLLEAGISIDIQIEVPEVPVPAPDILRIQVTLSDWENIIYDVSLLPDRNHRDVKH